MRQMQDDKASLEGMFSTPVRGFAVPFSYYSDLIADCARESGFEYARMSEFSGSYVPCRDWYYWKTGIFFIINFALFWGTNRPIFSGRCTRIVKRICSSTDSVSILDRYHIEPHFYRVIQKSGSFDPLFG